MERGMNSDTSRKKGVRLLFPLLILGAFVCAAILAPVIAPYDSNAIVNIETIAPSTQHLFGTDDLGRDIFSRAVYGARISLTVGLVAVSLSLIIGILLGALAGYFGGWLDSSIMRFVDIMLSFPSIFLILAIQAMLTPNIYNVMLVIGLTSWMGVARLVRGEYLKIRELQYVEAAQAIGCSHWRIIFRHILPNAQAPIIVAATLGMAGAILTESSLSFLGMGVQPPTPSWGNMLMDAQAYMRDAPWLAIIPGILILITVLSFYLIGEGLRQALDPRKDYAGS
ncbi:ABC transporter permease [Candidatus Saganbacteria bacterium]|nr:ABC transporter permease [Candidatus Saganbacteria bacterium]